MVQTDDDATQIARRRRLMQICTQATEAELEKAVVTFGDAADAEDVRTAEEGLVMLRGRIGGNGAAFNFGEATVTRAVIRLSNGTLGYSYLLGRTLRKARLAAVIDALGQHEQWHAKLEEILTGPVDARRASENRKQREETAATRVNFFTLVRGEDQP